MIGGTVRTVPQAPLQAVTTVIRIAMYVPSSNIGMSVAMVVAMVAEMTTILIVVFRWIVLRLYATLAFRTHPTADYYTSVHIPWCRLFRLLRWIILRLYTSRVPCLKSQSNRQQSNRENRTELDYGTTAPGNTTERIKEERSTNTANTTNNNYEACRRHRLRDPPTE